MQKQNEIKTKRDSKLDLDFSCMPLSFNDASLLVDYLPNGYHPTSLEKDDLKSASFYS